MKVKLFTHTDLDGVGCAILGELTFRNINIEYCDYHNINEKIKSFIDNKEYFDYDIIYITDISVGEDVAKMIDSLCLFECFRLLDHHETALWLNKYDWAKVEIIDEERNEKTSGTRLFYNEIKDKLEKSIKETDNKTLSIRKSVDSIIQDVEIFVEIVNRYDTWLWYEKYNDNISKQWNDLLYILGKERFINNVMDKIKNGMLFFDSSDTLVLALEQSKIDNYILQKDKELIVRNILGYKTGVVFAEQYHSELGNKLSRIYPELDFITIINLSKSISYRTTKEHIHLGNDVATILGGGGHPKAAGNPISDEDRGKILKVLFKTV